VGVVERGEETGEEKGMRARKNKSGDWGGSWSFKRVGTGREMSNANFCHLLALKYFQNIEPKMLFNKHLAYFETSGLMDKRKFTLDLKIT